MERETEDTAHLIDTEPVLILGCGSVEIMTLGGVGFVTGFVLGLILLSPFGFWFLSIPSGLLFALATVIVGGRRLGKAKEGKPDGYYNRYLIMKLSKVGMKGSFITHTGQWRIRR